MPSRHIKRGEVRIYAILMSGTDEGEWSILRSDRLTPVKETRGPSYRRLGGPQGRSGRVWKSEKYGPYSPAFQPQSFPSCLRVKKKRFPAPSWNSASKTPSINCWFIEPKRVGWWPFWKYTDRWAASRCAIRSEWSSKFELQDKMNIIYKYTCT